MKDGNCGNCNDTGILSATIIRGEDGKKRIAAVVCGGHYNNDGAEKSLLSMHKTTGLDVDVLRVENPK